MRLAWITDPHVSHCTPVALRKALRAAGAMDALLCTGDISEAPALRAHLALLQQTADCPLYFVLGNHDYYRTGLSELLPVLASLPPNITWLRTSDPVQLTPEVVLTGHDGWYDARAGDPWGTDVFLGDFLLVKELMQAARPRRHALAGVSYDRDPLIQLLRQVADAWAEEARTNLQKALALNPHTVLFATHVPPFQGACWHEGKVSNQFWSPWFVNTALGEVLRQTAQAHPKVQFEVYCGHTHSPGEYRPEDNLVVLTGQSKYNFPQVSKVIQI